MNFLRSSLGRFRFIGFLEGASFLLLLGVAMPLKYFAGDPRLVRTVGMAHGILFLLYVWAVIQVALEDRWSWWRTLGALVASLLPFGPFYFDAKVLKRDPVRPGA